MCSKASTASTAYVVLLKKTWQSERATHFFLLLWK